ncbi:hypothetical protein EG832_14750 [bacterium]|nr:hypothetical protein [bacterium]
MAESPLYLYKIQPVCPEMLTEGVTAEEDRLISEHFEYLKALTEKGVVFLAGRTLNTDPASFGIVIFAADSEEQARSLMHNDPAVKAHVMSAEFFPFRISLFSEKLKI